MRLEISGQARRDIQVIIFQSLASFGADQAARYHAGLLDLLELAAENPNMARLRHEFVKPARLLRYKSHVIFYRVEGNSVRIVRILHGKQNWHEYL